MLAIYRLEVSTILLLGFCMASWTSPAFGQGPGGRWALGRSAGVSFATRPPQAVLTTAAAYQPAEGGASIADENGALLFYTDGTQIYNRVHQVMPGSTNLGGHVSSSQSALIVRQPGSNQFYWVFTTDAIETFPNNHQGLRYTLVDMQTGSGLGAIVAGKKSVQLATNVAEKLTACATADGQGVWIITHEFGTARFMAWKLTAQGLTATTPIYSTAGATHGTAGNGNFNPGRGCMKASPDGSLLAAVVLPPTGDRYVAELFRFENATGQVSLLTAMSEPANGANDFNFYGVEFSPSGSKLYISTRKGPYTVVQYDLCSGNIAASKTVIGTSTNQFGTLQLGPDGRIYCAKNSDQYLGVIQNPEATGTASNYRDQGLNLTGRTSTYGLNNLSSSLFYKSKLTLTGQSGCQGQPLAFSAQASACGVARQPALTYRWNFGDPASGANNTANGLAATHVYNRAGTYRVILTGTWAEAVDTASYIVRVEAKPVGTASLDSNFCQGTRTITVDLVGQPSIAPPLTAQTGGAAADVQTSPGQMVVRTSANGNAWVRYVVTSPSGCKGDTQQVAFTVNQQQAPALQGPTDLCLEQRAPVYTPASAGNYLYLYDGVAATTAAPNYVPTILEAGTHSLQIAASTSTASRTCFTAGPVFTFTVRENTKLVTTAWDSAFCPEAPGSRYAVDVPATYKDSTRWTLTGSYTLQDDQPDAKQVLWASAPAKVTVRAITTPGCPAQTLSTDIQERCLEVMNLVTADNDGKNDHFYIKHLESYPGAEVALYTRHGKNVLKKTAKANTDFKTEELPGGTYFYLVSYTAGGTQHHKRGWVEVVR